MSENTQAQTRLEILAPGESAVTQARCKSNGSDN